MRIFLLMALFSWLAVGVEFLVPEIRYRFNPHVTVKYHDPGTPFPESDIERAIAYHGLQYGDGTTRYNWDTKQYEFKRDGQWIPLMAYQRAK